MSADPTKYTKTKLNISFFKVLTTIGITCFCTYLYIKHNNKRAVCNDQHTGDGKLMPVKKLNNGIEIPMLGLGTWELGDATIIDTTITHAIQIGYRLIDCASDYQNEYLIGDSLYKLIESKQVMRDEMFIISKLNQNFHAKKYVKKQLMKTLNDLRLDYLDLFLIHWPFSFEYVEINENVRGFENNFETWKKLQMPGISLQETWRAMEELVDEGLVKSIGVSNFNVQLLYDLLTYARIKPVINQIELHPFNQQNKLINFCRFAGIDVMAYSPLGTPGNIYINHGDNDNVLLENSVLNKIGRKYDVSAAQVSLKWNIQRDVIVVTKSSNIDRVSENKSLIHFELDDKDMEQIKGINKNLRYLRPEDLWMTTKDIPIFE